MAFQASEQAVAMVRADMIEASVEPGIVRVKKEEKKRYIPDVFYTYVPCLLVLRCGVERREKGGGEHYRAC